MKIEGSWISYFSSKAQREGGINLAQGRPGYFPPKDLLKFLKTLTKDKNLHQYAPGKGDFQLIEETLKVYKKFNKNLKKDNILIVQGATEGIELSYIYLWKKFKENFSILTFEPYYESYLKLSLIFNIPLHLISINPFDLSWDREKLKKTVINNNVKGIILASPGNPLGKVWKREEIEFLRNLMESNGGFLIFDSVYENLYFFEEVYNPLKKGLKNLIFISSFSKTLSITGWRIGYIICKDKELEEISSIHDFTGLSAPYILQRSISNYLKKENLDFFLKKLRDNLKRNFFFSKERLEKKGFIFSKVEGGIFAWVKLPKKFKNSLSFCKNLFSKEKVSCVPGINFSPKDEGFIRLNLSLPYKIFKEGIEKIERFVQ